MRTKDLAKFILERESIRVKKEAGKPRPWTKDVVLDTYRFCNVHREDDKVTRWIAENWRAPNADNPELWFAMVFARLFNLPRTLGLVGAPNVLNWRSEKVRDILHKARAGGAIFNGAYIVSTNGRAMDKVDYLVDFVLRPLWADRKQIGRMLCVPDVTLRVFHSVLMKYDGLGSFMAAQVVADLKYVEPLSNAEDWWTWAASGPGSRRGLNRVFMYDTSAPWNEGAWLQHLTTLRESLRPLLKPVEKTLYGESRLPLAVEGHALHAQDLQNCLCEFDKYERIRLGEGRPKQLYRG